MTDKEFHALSKLELLEIMQMLEEEVETLQTENAALKKEQNEIDNERLEWQAERDELQSERKQWQIERADFIKLFEELQSLQSVDMKHVDESKHMLDEAREKVDKIKRESAHKNKEIAQTAAQTAAVFQELLDVYFNLLWSKA